MTFDKPNTFHRPNCSRFKTNEVIPPMEGHWTWSQVRELGLLAETEHLIGFYDYPCGYPRLHWKVKKFKFNKGPEDYLRYKNEGELKELYEKAVALWKSVLKGVN